MSNPTSHHSSVLASRWRALRVAIVVVVSLLASSFAIGTATTAEAAVTGSTQAAQAARYPTYCTHYTSKDVQRTTCVHITKIYGRVFNVIYRDGAMNSGKGSASVTCKAETSRTFTWTVSASVKAEAGAIFAHVSAEVSGGISHSVTSTYGATISKTIPGHQTLFCDRGIYTYSFRGKVSRTVCSSVNCSNSYSNFSGKAPQRALWHVYVGH